MKNVKGAKKLGNDKTKVLIIEFNDSKDPKEKALIRDRIILGHVGLVGKIAYQLCIRAEKDYEDMLQQGMLALTIAFDKYDASKGTPFHLFAWRVINNRLISHSYKLTYGWLHGLPNCYATKGETTAIKVDIDGDFFIAEQREQRGQIGQRIESFSRFASSSDTFKDVADKDMWEYLMTIPNETQREALDLHYNHDMPITKVAKLLHSTPSAISQRMVKGKDAIREYLNENK